MIISIVSGLVVAAGGYLLVVKENQVRIEGMQSTLEKLQESSENMRNSLNVTKLFVAQAHPDRNFSRVSLLKLQNLSKDEIATLAAGLEDVKIAGPDKEVRQAPAEIRELMKKHNLTGEDILAYHEVAASPVDSQD